MSKFLYSLSTVSTCWLLVLVPGAATAQAGPPSYLHLSDIHLDLCGTSSDTDPQLWAITQGKLASILSGPDAPAFVLYTGDLPGHYECSNPDCALDASQKPAHQADIWAVLSSLHDLVAETGIPLLYLPGNNDSLAGDYFSFTDSAGRTPLSLVPGVPYPAVNAATPCGSPPCTVSNPAPDLGFYSARPVDGLRVIALNTIIFDSKYHEVDGTIQLAAGKRQLDWLATELADAHGREKVLIALHIPPGIDAYKSAGNSKTWMWARQPKGGSVWLDRFLDLLAAHGDTVIGLAYGHTHMDELRRLHNRAGEVIEVAISAPGITTNHGNNPGFKLVSYDGDTKELLDFVTLYTERGNTTWGDKRYTFSKLFDCADVTILECLTGDRYTDSAAIDAVMEGFYTVMNDPPSYPTQSGIEVEYGQ